jgi:hypothetical protein
MGQQLTTYVLKLSRRRLLPWFNHQLIKHLFKSHPLTQVGPIDLIGELLERKGERNGSNTPVWRHQQNW